MTQHDEDPLFLQKCKRMLDQREQSLDDDTKQALNAIRKQALAGVDDSSTAKYNWLGFAPYQAFAATAVVVAVVSVALHFNMPASGNDLPQLDDILLLTESDDLGFYQDLDFYNWLEQEQIDG